MKLIRNREIINKLKTNNEVQSVKMKAYIILSEKSITIVNEEHITKAKLLKARMLFAYQM
jgi:hypothetical protein